MTFCDFIWVLNLVRPIPWIIAIIYMCCGILKIYLDTVAQRKYDSHENKIIQKKRSEIYEKNAHYVNLS